MIVPVRETAHDQLTCRIGVKKRRPQRSDPGYIHIHFQQILKNRGWDQNLCHAGQEKDQYTAEKDEKLLFPHYFIIYNS